MTRHDENLVRMMERTKERGLSLSYDKCHIKQNSIGFYGHILTSEGIKPDPSKVFAIKDMKPPQNINQLLSFLSSAKYLSSFTPDLSNLCAPLNKLTRKDVDFQSGPEHQEAFERIKDNIASIQEPIKGSCSIAILAYFDPTKSVTISHVTHLWRDSEQYSTRKTGQLKLPARHLPTRNRTIATSNERCLQLSSR